MSLSNHTYVFISLGPSFNPRLFPFNVGLGADFTPIVEQLHYDITGHHPLSWAIQTAQSISPQHICIVADDEQQANTIRHWISAANHEQISICICKDIINTLGSIYDRDHHAIVVNVGLAAYQIPTIDVSALAEQMANYIQIATELTQDGFAVLINNNCANLHYQTASELPLIYHSHPRQISDSLYCSNIIVPQYIKLPSNIQQAKDNLQSPCIGKDESICIAPAESLLCHLHRTCTSSAKLSSACLFTIPRAELKILQANIPLARLDSYLGIRDILTELHAAVGLPTDRSNKSRTPIITHTPAQNGFTINTLPEQIKLEIWRKHGNGHLSILTKTTDSHILLVATKTGIRQLPAVAKAYLNAHSFDSTPYSLSANSCSFTQNTPMPTNLEIGILGSKNLCLTSTASRRSPQKTILKIG